MTQSILIIDDETDIRDVLADIFTDEGFIVHKAAHSEQALSLISQNQIDLIVLDIWLDNSDMDGIQILKHLKTSSHNTIPVLMISGHGNIEMAVNAMKIGAFDFIEKPFKIDHILLTAQRALEQKALRDENRILKETSDIGTIDHSYKSTAMIQLFKKINEHADSDARIFIAGENGSGKTRIARLIHDNSKRSKNSFKKMYAGDFSIKSFEALCKQVGQGTILIESVEKMNAQQQSEFLSFLTKQNLNCRIIVTAFDDITNKIQHQEFSSALYDRLSVIKIELPSLKDRLEDFEILVNEFSEKISHDLMIKKPVFSKEIIQSLQLFDWTGNIRQLKLAIEWLVITYKENLSLECLSRFIIENQQFNNENNIDNNDVSEAAIHQLFQIPLKTARDEFEKMYLNYNINKFHGNIAKMSVAIDMERTALYRKLKTLVIPTDWDTQQKTGS